MYGQLSKLGSLLGSFFIRVPYYLGDPKKDPNLENYLYVEWVPDLIFKLGGRFGSCMWDPRPSLQN